MGGTDTEYKAAHKVDSGENSPATPAGIQTRNLSITSLALLPTSYPGYSKGYFDKFHPVHKGTALSKQPTTCLLYSSDAADE